MLGKFDPKLLRGLPGDESHELSPEEAMKYLEGLLTGLMQEVAKYDERLEEIKLSIAACRELTAHSPNDNRISEEIIGLTSYLAILGDSRAYFAGRCQKVRDEIRARIALAKKNQPQAKNKEKTKLQLKIETFTNREFGKTRENHQGSYIQPELDFLADSNDVEPLEEETGASRQVTNPEVDKTGLIRERHPNRDFFLADMFDYALKDDGASMEAPIFTLSTKADLSVWSWVSKDGSRSIKVAPSVLGRATQHDKDVLIYVVSQLTEALNRGRNDAKSRVVRFTVYDFLVTTNRGIGGDDYKRLQEAFERLSGTRITTDIKTGGQRVKEGFGIIDRWKIIERSPEDERMVAVEITLSEWLYNAVQAHEVLTIHPDYFRLRKPIARRLYELARKHCGHQAQWPISLHLLHEKSGSRGSIYEFHEALKAIATEDSLPEYRVSLSPASRVSNVKVTFHSRDSKRAAIASLGKLKK